MRGGSRPGTRALTTYLAKEGEMDKVAGPDRLGAKIAGALGLKENTVRRLIIDCQACKPPVVYIESADDETMYDINWELLVKGAEVRLIWGEAKVDEERGDDRSARRL